MKFGLKNILDKGKNLVPKRPAKKVSGQSKIKVPEKLRLRSRVEDPKRLGKFILLALILVIFTAEFGFAISIYAFKSHDAVTKQAAAIIPYPAAFTASGIVTVSQYWKEKDYIEHFYASTKQESVNGAELSQQILRQEAENQIIKKEALKYKISISSKDIDDSMAQIYDNNGGEAEVEKALQDLYGLNVQSFRQLVGTQLLRDRINKEVIKQVRVRHILIRVEEGAAQEKIDEAKARITDYTQQIKSGAITFEDAATKYSEDVGSNQDGGLLETFAHGDMVKEFEDVAFSTKVGEISEPFRTSFGWHVLKVESVSGRVDQSFDEWLNGLMKNDLFLELYKDNG